MLFLLGFAVIPAMMQVRVAPEDVEPDYERDDERADGAHCAHEGTGACEQHRDKAKHGGHAVQHRDSLLLIEAEREESVMEMPLVGMERALPVDYPAEEGESRVRQRHCERQQRHEEGYYGMEFEHAEDGDR